MHYVACLEMGASGKTTPIDCLVDSGADLASQDSEGRTPLMAAIMRASVLDKKIETLIHYCEGTPALNITDKDGNNVLHLLASMKESKFTKDTIKVKRFINFFTLYYLSFSYVPMLIQNRPTKMISTQGTLQSITKTSLCMRS